MVTHGLVFPILGRGRDTGDNYWIAVSKTDSLWPLVATHSHQGRPGQIEVIDSALKHLGMLTEPVEHGGDITIRWQTEEEAKGS